MKTIHSLWLLLIFFSATLAATNTPLSFKPTVIATEAHNPAWFTQGFYRNNDGVFISSGLYGQSQLIYQGPQKTSRYTLANKYFAEGLTIIDNTLYLLTWKENTLLLFDKNTLQPIKQLHYKGEGWGLTDNDRELIMSNGSNQIFFRNKDTFDIIRTLTIKTLDYFNELEYIDGIIWANRWYDDNIYAIDSQSGCVLANINLSALRQQATQPDNKNIANGIAYDDEHKGLWVTGKYWNKRFLITLPSITNAGNKMDTCQQDKP